MPRPSRNPTAEWHGGISISGAVASGKGDAKVLAATADAVRETSADKVTLYGVGGPTHSKSGSATTADLLRLGGRYDRNLSERVFAFGGTEVETNKAGGIDSRYALNAGLGYKLIRTQPA